MVSAAVHPRRHAQEGHSTPSSRAPTRHRRGGDRPSRRRSSPRARRATPLVTHGSSQIRAPPDVEVAVRAMVDLGAITNRPRSSARTVRRSATARRLRGRHRRAARPPALTPFSLDDRTLGRSTARSSSTRAPPRRATRSATGSSVEIGGRSQRSGRRHRDVRRGQVARHRDVRDLRPGDRPALSTSRARLGLVAAKGPSRPTALRSARAEPAADAQVRRASSGGAGRAPRLDWFICLLRRSLLGVRLRGRLRRRVHHLQHALDHGRAAHA